MGLAMTGGAVALAGWVVGWLILFRLPRCRSAALEGWPTVSVIIPARNEEANLPRLLQSLQMQPRKPDEILVVDDDSTDRTAACAAAGGARVLTSKPLAPGWRGKAWACFQGSQEAGGDVLVFLDADTYLAPGGFERMIQTFASHSGAMSIAPDHRIRLPYENLSAFFNLLMVMGIGAFTAWGRPGRATGFVGPCLLISAQDYTAVGGHESVKGEVLENLHLAKRLTAQGLSTHCYGGRNTLSFRMYPDGLPGLLEGWRKAFASGAAQTPPVLHILIVFWLSTAAISAAALPLSWLGDASIWVPALVGYGLFALQIGIQLRRIGNFSPWAAALYPVPLFFFFGLFFQSRGGKQATWKGRDVSVNA